VIEASAETEYTCTLLGWTWSGSAIWPESR